MVGCSGRSDAIFHYRMSIIDTLVSKNIIAKDDVGAIRREMTDSGANLEEILLKRGVNADDILSAKGEYLGIPALNLAKQNVPNEILKYVPEESAIYYKFVPIAVRDGRLEVGIVDPDNMEARDALNFISSKNNLPYKIFLI